MNNRSFEDFESILKEIYPRFILRCIFGLHIAYVHSLSFSFDDFLASFSRSN
jgi:hypothetical protein